jgi:hypothetical protein
MAESNIGLRLCGRCSHVLTDRSAACDYTETRTEQNNHNHPPRVVIQTTTALDRVKNRLETKSALKHARSRPVRTKSVRFTLPTTAWERLTARLGTKSARNNARSSGLKTNSVRRLKQLKPILEEKTTHPLGTEFCTM